MKGNFNVRGALEWMVYFAKETGKIQVPKYAGVQTMLNALAGTLRFEEIARKVAVDRCLKFDRLSFRATCLYDEVSKHVHENDLMITVRVKDFTPDECGALIAYLELQKEWPAPLNWVLEEKPVEHGPKATT
ncbi:unnamed protein product [Tuber aestivum]|uniref:Uncharacterized protein n=1 Tax=Tuber aestivum TaxID=59557 RepID=A0A292Q1Y1_9PEZI|nr:unnamed protein product [Tuber aestivum]